MRPAKRSVVVVLSPILIISLWLAGCGPTNGFPPLKGEFLYITNSDDGTISEFSINTVTGALTRIGSFNTMAASGDLDALAVHPTNEFIYDADGPTGVLGFDLGDGGFSGLIFQQNSNVPPDEYDVAITPNGQFLYATDNSSSEVSEYSIDLTSGTPTSPNLDSGALTSIGTVPSGLFPTGVAVESAGNYAYAVAGGGVSEYVVQPSGMLAANGNLIFPTGALFDQIATSRRGEIACAYVTEALIPGGLQEMAIDNSTGTLSYLGEVPVATSLQGIAVHPNGNFIYATEPFFGGTGTTIISKIDVFTEIAASQGAPPCTAGLSSQITLSDSEAPIGIAVEPMGKFAYTANSRNGTVGEFSIDSSTGALTSIGEVSTESPPKPLSAPVWLATTH
jgi:DNA-binding beta-propeller fold protein YncE